MGFCICCNLLLSQLRTCRDVAGVSAGFALDPNWLSDDCLLWTCEWTHIGSGDQNPCTLAPVHLKRRSEQIHRKTSYRLPASAFHYHTKYNNVYKKSNLQYSCNFVGDLKKSCRADGSIDSVHCDASADGISHRPELKSTCHSVWHKTERVPLIVLCRPIAASGLLSCCCEWMCWPAIPSPLQERLVEPLTECHLRNRRAACDTEEC